MPRVVHFEIHADNPQRAIEFYSKVFGWRFRKWDGPEEYWFVTTGPAEEKGINGGLVRRADRPGTGGPSSYVCTIDVSSVDEYSARVEAAGGAITAPKFPVPGCGWFAHGRDTEGNTFSITEADS